MSSFVHRVTWKTWAAALGIAVAIAVFVWLNQTLPRLALFWVFGVALGFVLQRSRFCFVSGISNCFLFKDTRQLEGVMVGLFLATIGFAAVMNYVPAVSGGGVGIAAGAVATPFGWHLLLAGAMFGFGMMLAGGCIMGNLYRIGEGAVSALIVFIGVMAGMGILQFTWPWWWNNYISKLSSVWLPDKIGWAGAIALTLGVIIALYVILRIVRGRSEHTQIESCENTPAWPSRITRWGRAIFKTGWPLAAGGIVLALINIVMYWTLNRPWTVTGELMTWAQGLFDTLHLPPPPVGAVPGS
jgi:uncharacterized protein